MSTLLLLVVFSVICTVNAAPAAVTSVNIAQYTGYWYQMYSNIASKATFEKDSFCSTARYGANDDGTVSVRNAALIGAPNGTASVVNGYAYAKDPSQPAELNVHFDDVPSPVDGSYWIVALGPIVNSLYDYAIVSDKTGTFLFVLARDYATFKTTYEATVLEQVREMGFTGVKKPIAEYQGSDCAYETAKVSGSLKSSPKTVSSLTLSSYLGLWYEMYNNKPSHVFEGDSYCATALYGDNGNGTISVHNDARMGSATGSDKFYNGYAYYTQSTEPGQLMVHLDGVDRDASYFIILLGPIVESYYQYAVVSDVTGVFLYILARDPAAFKTTYEADVLASVKTLGFTGLTAPVSEYQGNDCLYESTN